LNEIKSNPEENTKKEQSSLKRIGNFIKEARLSREQSVEELASDLKIGSHQLKAIEEGNEEELPEKVFVKAMVRRISQKLKLDTEFIMNEFETEKQEVKIEEIVEEVAKKTNKTRKSKDLSPVGFWIFILISGLLGLIASSLILNLFSDSSQNQTPKQEIIKKTGQVCIQIRDVQGVDDNPFDFETVKKNIEDRLNPEFEGQFKIMLVPNITNICYGRGVGYKIEEIVLDEETQKISATKIRAKMREEGKLK